MAQKTLSATILLMGQADNTFTQLGAQLTEMGNQVNKISRELINIGKQGIDTYRDYETSMLDAQGALSSRYKDTAKLQNVMEKLNAAASKWAATTIFHTDDVANGIAVLAHAGKDYDEIIGIMPAAMELAQAGGMNLAGALEMLVDSLNASETSFENAGEFVDMWAMAANSSNTTIEEMGNALTRLSASATFTKTNEEMFTMLALMANVGIKGETAGTGLRNVMIRLVAPTKAAKDAMEEFGMTESEWNEVVSEISDGGKNEDLINALQTIGFSAYNSEGKLKSFTEIFSDLGNGMASVFGNDWTNDATAIDLLSTIFPMRTLNAGIELTKQAYGGWHDLMGSIERSDGYGETVATIMTSGLDGAIKLFESKVEEAERKLGETLAPTLETILGSVGEVLDKINGADGGTWDAVVSALGVLATAGPAMLLAGVAFKMIGYAMTPIGAATAGLLALSAAAAALHTIAEAEYTGQFGDMALDSGKLSGYISELGGEFETAYGKVKSLNDELGKIAGTYETASSDLAKVLTTGMLTGEVNKDAAETYAEKMADALVEVIVTSDNASLATLENEMGGTTIWSQIMDVFAIGQQSSIARAEELSKQLRDALTSAFDDGALSSDEIQKIMNIIQQQNELLAMETERANYQERQRMLRKAQTLGIDGITEIASMAAAQRDAELETLDYAQSGAMFDLGYYYDQLISQGIYTKSDKEAAMAALTESQAAERSGYAGAYDDFLLSLFNEAIRGSDLAGAWNNLMLLGNAYGVNGGNLDSKLYTSFNATVGTKKQGLVKLLSTVIEAFGGTKLMAGSSNSGVLQLLDMNEALGKTLAPTDISGNWALNIVNKGDFESNAYAAIAAGQAVLNANPGHWPIRMSIGTGGDTLEEYAEGGRATVASIFGEAGAEWAIPEEHSARTADLLNAARKASGFTWAELINRNGGLNAGGGSTNTLVYSPTINGGGSDIESLLLDDKRRLERWWRERAMRDDVEVYA